MNHRRCRLAGPLTLMACTLACAQPARVTRGIDWADSGVWLDVETHTQTRFTDGLQTVEEIVAAATRHGCDAVAITDHADENLKGGTPEYVEAIRAARAAHPGILVITGLEWNVPPGKGQEHANVFFPTAMETAEFLGDFRTRFDDEKKTGENPELALAGLAALAPQDPGALAPVVTFNHPSRWRNSTSAPAITFEALKNAAPDLLVGFEGAPGHQRSTPLGAYPAGTLIDRWDPIAAIVGGVWDQWLQKGLDVWGALASSDFHGPAGEYWPCEFSATRVYAPDRTVDGVIRALRAGSFFAEHGHIVEQARLEARFEGQPHVFRPGEIAAASAGEKAMVSLSLDVPPRDYAGQSNRIDTVELIGISKTAIETLYSGPPASAEAFSIAVTVPPGGIVLRARGRRAMDDGSGLLFYTNPIRINAR